MCRSQKNQELSCSCFTVGGCLEEYEAIVREPPIFKSAAYLFPSKNQFGFITPRSHKVATCRQEKRIRWMKHFDVKAAYIILFFLYKTVLNLMGWKSRNKIYVDF